MRKRRIVVLLVGVFFALGAVAIAAAKFSNVKPQEFDPAHTFLVQSSWEEGIGCPTNAATSSDGSKPADGTFTAGGCPTGDDKDKRNQGLLLVKTGPTSNVAAATADLKDVKGTTVTELGYDIRKPGSDQNDPRGSHCGAGSPRFDVTDTNGNTTFIGCNSPAPTVTNAGDGWLRLRWTIPPTPVSAISIIADEGQDTGPDNFGLSVLDNIDVNGTLVGQGPRD